MSVDESVLERLQAQQLQMFQVSDVLDMKAGIFLVFVTFLATQTAGFFRMEHLPTALWSLQLVSAGMIATAGILVAMVLRTRTFPTFASTELTGWVEELREYVGDADNAEQQVEKLFTEGSIDGIKERIENTISHRQEKVEAYRVGLLCGYRRSGGESDHYRGDRLCLIALLDRWWWRLRWRWRWRLWRLLLVFRH